MLMAPNPQIAEDMSIIFNVNQMCNLLLRFVSLNETIPPPTSYKAGLPKLFVLQPKCKIYGTGLVTQVSYILEKLIFYVSN